MIGVAPDNVAESKLPFNQSDVEAGGGRVAAFYLSEGFVDAVVDVSGTRVSPSGKSAEIVVRIT
jgi:hypothetical protein